MTCDFFTAALPAVHAINWMASFYRYARKQTDGPVPYPWIVPCGGGGIQLEWHHNKKSVEIEFNSDGTTEFAVFDESDGKLTTIREGHLDPIDNENAMDYVLNLYAAGD